MFALFWPTIDLTLWLIFGRAVPRSEVYGSSFCRFRTAPAAHVGSDRVIWPTSVIAALGPVSRYCLVVQDPVLRDCFSCGLGNYRDYTVSVR